MNGLTQPQEQVNSELKQRLELYAAEGRIITGNPNLKYRIGKPGGGSFVNLATLVITLDPEHLINIDEGDFVNAHECSHVAQTVPPDQLHKIKLKDNSTGIILKLSKEQVEEVFKKIGFASTNNVIEDCAINDGLVRGYIGKENPTRKAYHDQLDIGQGLLSHPEILDIARQIGRVPRFSLALSSILSAWANIRDKNPYDLSYASIKDSKIFIKTGNKDVDDILETAVKDIKQAIDTTLTTGKEAHQARMAIGFQRFLLIKEKVFPHIQKLVELDIKDEQLRQTAKNQNSKDQSDQQGESGQSDASAQGGALSNQATDEIAKAISEAKNKMISDKAKQLSDLLNSDNQQEQTPGDSDLQEEIEKLIGDDQNLKDALDELLEDNPNPSKEQIEQILSDNLEQDTENNFPLDIDTLSDETKKELQDLFDNLSEEEKEQIKEQALRPLEDIDDIIAEIFAPKLENNPTQNHKDRRDQADFDAQKEQLQKAAGALGQALRQRARELATPYQRIYQDISDKLNEVIDHVKHLFKPEKDEEYIGAFASGQQLNLPNAMQFEVDPSFHEKLFDQRIDPKKYDYEFQLIIDRSGSMQGQKLEQTKRAAVFLTELLTSFRIPHQIAAFDDVIEILKTWDDEIQDPAIQKNIAESLTARGGTDDASAISKAYQESLQKKEKHKFIIMFSDADSGADSELKKILKQIQDDRKVILVHFGVGPGTTDTNGYYAHSFGDLPITSPNTGSSFFEVFVEQLEKMILNPSAFKGKNNE